MVKPNVFDFKSYRDYVREALGGTRKRTGLRMQAAAAMGCQPTYLSQVLQAKTDLSLEQGLKLSQFLAHASDERQMFLLLIQLERAGTGDLREHFTQDIETLLQRRTLIKNRLKAQNGLTSEDQSIYYGSWIYSCVHVLVTIPDLSSADSIAAYLGLSRVQVAEVLSFLESRKLIVDAGEGNYQAGPLHLHLPDDSPHLQKHHANWRLRAIQSFDRKTRSQEMHYSAVVTISEKDAALVKEKLMRCLQENVETITNSPAENVYCYNIDWFELQPK